MFASITSVKSGSCGVVIAGSLIATEKSGAGEHYSSAASQRRGGHRGRRPTRQGGQWDSDLWLLGVPNGVVDLRIGVFKLDRRENLITMNAGVPFDADATCLR